MIDVCGKLTLGMAFRRKTGEKVNFSVKTKMSHVLQSILILCLMTLGDAVLTESSPIIFNKWISSKGIFLKWAYFYELNFYIIVNLNASLIRGFVRKDISNMTC